MPQRLDGIEAGRLDRREHPEHEAHGGTEGETHDDRPERNVRLVQTGVRYQGQPDRELEEQSEASDSGGLLVCEVIDSHAV